MAPVVDARTGFVYLKVRYYDPETGQFLTKDPIAEVTGQPYAYASDNPLNLVDRNGLWPEPAGEGPGPQILHLGTHGRV